MSDETHTISFRPAFHRCSNERGKDYGVGEPRIIWTLRIGGDAITWDVSTGWGMPAEAFRAACRDCESPRHRNGWPFVQRRDGGTASGGVVDWHYSRPINGDENFGWHYDQCAVLDGPCWADAGYLLGDELFDLLRVEGDEAVWVKLRELLLTTHAEVAT